MDLPHHVGLEAKVADLIIPTLVDMGYELVRVAIMGRERPTVQIMADRADGAQIAVEDCEKISHAVGAVLDVNDPIAGAWMLEVSSAGIDRPLTRIKDWNRYAGFAAKVETVVPVNGRKRFNGIILGADAESARLRMEDGSDAVLPMMDIRRARLVLSDELIEFTANLNPTN